MATLKVSYDPKLSIEENAKKFGCSIANVRKYIQTAGIDRRYDSKLALWRLVNDFYKENPNTTLSMAAKALEISPNTVKKYKGTDKPTQIDPTKVSKFDLSKYCNVVKSVGTNDECLHGIYKLYLPNGLDIDLTYSVGGIYSSSGLPHPKLKFDKFPLWEKKDKTEFELKHIKSNPNILKVEKLDNIYRLVQWHTYNSVLFDLPFFWGKKNGYLKMVERFSSFSTEEELIQTNINFMFWASQLLRPNGILVVKTQNIQTGGHQTWINDILSSVASEIGLEKIDEFIFLNKSKAGIAAFCKTQHVARKTHGYYLVFRRVMPKGLVKELKEDGVI